MMRSGLLMVTMVIGACADSEPVPPTDLAEACESRVCPAEPPDSIDCQPIVSEEWRAACAQSCREFLQQSCDISFSD